MVCISHSAVSSSLRQHGLWLARLLSQQDFPGKNTGEGCHSLLQGIFLTQRLNPGLLHCRQFFFLLSELVGDYGQQVLWETFNCIDAYFCRLKEYLDTCYLFSPLILSFFSYFQSLALQLMKHVINIKESRLLLLVLLTGMTENAHTDIQGLKSQ